MIRNTLIPVIVIAFSIMSTQSIAFFISTENSYTLNYIALWTIGLQWISFIHAGGFFRTEKTEKYFDLIGSVTFVTATIINFFMAEQLSIRTKLLSLFVILWTVRLGAFLSTRIKRNNGIDARFDEFKTTNFKFLMIWTLQGLWVFIMLLPLFIATQNETNLHLKIFDFTGFILFITGLTCESIADYQKLKFRSEPKNKEKFIKTGLWKYSRHPNYFGEILLWFSIALIAFSGTESFLVFVAPVFIASALIFGSGIPILEKIGNEHFGKNEQYKIYKKCTPVLIPFIGRAGDAMF